jgi:hypothetical protein
MLPKPISATAAIERAGPELFGTDWIGRLNDAEMHLLKRYGPQSHETTKGGPRCYEFPLTVKPCPPTIGAKLDRAMGREVRMNAQRAFVLHWLFSKSLISGNATCSKAELVHALGNQRAQRPGQKTKNKDGGNRQGRPPILIESVAHMMLSHLRSGKLTRESLQGMTGKELEAIFDASRNTCFKARKIALAEHGRLFDI